MEKYPIYLIELSDALHYYKSTVKYVSFLSRVQLKLVLFCLL